MRQPAMAAAVILATLLVNALPGHCATFPPIITTDISGSDLDFFMGAARETALIARLSSLAMKSAVTPEVQALAAGVAQEQTAAAAGLKTLAESKAVPLPEEPDGAGRKQLQTLAALKGPRFDKSYLDALADAEDSLQASLDSGAASTDKDIRAYALAGKGTLKAEREKIRKLGM